MRLLKIVLAVLAVVIGVPVLFVAYLVVRVKFETRHDLSIVSSGEVRTYQLHVPKSVDPQIPVPLVISLHAAAGWPQLQRDLSQWDRVADEKGFIVAYPRGGNVPSTWNVDRGSGLERDVRFIAQLIDTISAHYAIDTARIYANGLSNGGGMSFVLACKLHDRIAAVGIVSGAETLPFDWCKDATPVPALIVHGELDKIVPYAGGPLGDPFNPAHVEFPSAADFAASWARHNGCADDPRLSTPATDVIRREYANCKDSATVDFYTITDGGHQWPGGKPIPQWWVGPFTSTLNTSEVLWDFFARHPRRKPPATVSLHWSVSEHSSYKWRANAAPYEFIVETQHPGDPYARDRRLRIRVPGASEVVVTPPGGLATVVTENEMGSLPRALASKNLMRSEWVYLAPMLRLDDGSPILLLFGTIGEEEPGSMQAYVLDSAGTPRAVLSLEAFGPDEIVDLDADGQLEIIGKKSFSQAYGKCLLTYDPYSVYRAPRTWHDSATYDLALSERYTRAHMGGWAGPNSSEEYAVVQCGKDRPRVMSKDSAYKAEH